MATVQLTMVRVNRPSNQCKKQWIHLCNISSQTEQIPACGTKSHITYRFMNIGNKEHLTKYISTNFNQNVWILM